MTVAFITPSYLPDLERCRLLVESVERYAPDSMRHYVIVDRRDLSAFSSLASARTQVVVKQDVVPTLHQLRIAAKWWAVGLGLPVRGWIVQQIIKLSVDRLSDADTFVFLDSDAVLVRPFDPPWARPAAPVPLFREQGPALVSDMNTAWHQVSAERLGIPAPQRADINYVGALVTWRRDALVGLHRRLEEVSGRSWVESVVRLRRLSEYTLYGVYVEQVLGIQAAGHAADSWIPTLNHWAPAPMDRRELTEWIARLGPDQYGVMVSAKSGTAVADLRATLVDAGYL